MDMADQSPELLSAEEVERWAETLADELLDPKSWLRTLVLKGFGQPDLMQSIAPLVRIPEVNTQFDPTVVPALNALVLSGDRDNIRSIIKRVLSEMPRVTFDWFRTNLDPAHTRKLLLAEASKLKGKQGPQPKLSPSTGKELVSRADSLYPVLLRVLRDLEGGTKHSAVEMLDFLRADYEGPVIYVRRHILKLEEVLRNPPKHLASAKRIETRAKLLAEGLAGCDDEYSFNTSVEKVRQARRRSASFGPVDSPREK